MLTTIDRYIYREIAVPLILGIAAFTSVLLMSRFLKIAEMVVAKGVSLGDILLMIAYLLPSFGLFTLPMAFLLAVLLAFGRLSADSEVVAIKACGTGLARLLRPVMATALATTIATAYIALYAAPAGNTAFKALLTRTAVNQADIEIKDRVFMDTIPGLVLYTDRYDPVSRSMTDVMIQDERDAASPLTIFARQGSITTNMEQRQVRLQLANGTIHRAMPDNGYRLAQFDDYSLTVNIGNTGKGISRNEGDMTVAELQAGIRTPAINFRLRKEMEIELYRRSATPFACLVFALAGLPLGIQNQRSGKGSGFAVSICLILIYYILLSAGKALAGKEILHAAVAMWLPNIIFLLLGAWFFRQAACERRILPDWNHISPVKWIQRWCPGIGGRR